MSGSARIRRDPGSHRAQLQLGLLAMFLVGLVLAGSWPAASQAVAYDHNRFFMLPYYADYLKDTANITGTTLSYRSPINESTNAPDHVALSILLHQGTNSTTPHTVEGTVYMSDGTQHQVRFDAYPVYLVDGVDLWGTAWNTKLVWTLDGVENNYSSFGPDVVPYVDIALKREDNSSYIITEDEPATARGDNWAFLHETPVVVAPTKPGVFIIGYELTSNFEAEFYLHGYGINEVEYGFNVGAGDVFEGDPVLNAARGLIGGALDFISVIIFILGPVGYILFNPQRLTAFVIAVVVLDVAYRINTSKSIFRALGLVLKDMQALVMGIIGFLGFIVDFIYNLISAIKSLVWPF